MHIKQVLISVVGINALKLLNSKLFECPVKLTCSFVERLRGAPKVSFKKHTSYEMLSSAMPLNIRLVTCSLLVYKQAFLFYVIENIYWPTQQIMQCF